MTFIDKLSPLRRGFLLLAALALGLAGCAPVPQPEPTPSQPAAALPTQAPSTPPTPAPTRTPAPTETLPLPTPTQPSPTPAFDPFAADLPLSQTGYVLPLTIRHVTETQAVLFFELDRHAAGALYYQALSPTPGAVYSIPLNTAETRQQIILDGLQAGASYRALVGLDGPAGALEQPSFQQTAWGSLAFHTLSADPQQPLRVGVLGDASFGDSASAALVERMATYPLDFVIHTGDVVANIQDDAGPVEAYGRKFYQTLAPLLHQVPIYTVIGNHDYDLPAAWRLPGGEDSVFYYYAFPLIPDLQNVSGLDPAGHTSQYYAFAVRGIQFMMLDSEVLYGIPGRAAEEAWMSERLADPRFRCTIPVLHVPPYYSGAVHPTDQLVVRSQWAPLFAAAHVPLALSGHSHHYERLSADGTTYIVSGGGSSVLYALGETQPQSQVFARRTHFVLLEIGEQAIDLTAITVDGETIDQAVIPLP